MTEWVGECWSAAYAPLGVTGVKGFVEILDMSLIEIMRQLKLDQHGKLGSTERPFRPSMGLLNSAHSRLFTD
ncbi:unnamed protein product [Schistosoma margrebowiei]|uniref:Uncharacterized protein n=1 Tax=Schistosoma margrebowiei TaxID=48269 RepID=A0A183LB46_9TREM|nr:unnamed protein product [Schistosoma margrebowiei]